MEVAQSTGDQTPVVSDKEFESAKRNYFIELGRNAGAGIREHRKVGVLDRHENKANEWRNVTEHCLVVAARAREFGRLLGLSEDVIQDMVLAATVHDIYKRDERPIIIEGQYSWDSFEEAERQSADKMAKTDLPERAKRLTDSFGHSKVLDQEARYEKSELSDEDLASMILHYVDDYTRDTQWVEPGDDPLTSRLVGDSTKDRYISLNEDGKKYFGGRTTYEAMIAIGQKIAQTLSEALAERGFGNIAPEDLPYFIDTKIKQDISDLALASAEKPQ